jgi:hypothetical protein
LCIDGIIHVDSTKKAPLPQITVNIYPTLELPSTNKLTAPFSDLPGFIPEVEVTKIILTKF